MQAGFPNGSPAWTGRRGAWWVQMVGALLLPLLGALFALGAGSVLGREESTLRADLRALERWDEALDHIESVMPAAEGAVRGFRLTGARDTARLAAYRQARGEVAALVDILREAPAGFPGLDPHASALAEALPHNLRALEELRRVVPEDLAAERGAAAREMDAARHLMQVMETAEEVVEDLIEQREAQLAQVLRDQGRAWLAVPLGLLVSVVVAVNLVRQGGRRIHILSRNLSNLVEGRDLEPFPYDGSQLDRLGLAVERAADLLDSRERQRVAARNEAERANQAKTAFLSRMSHELRTPLTAVLGFAELLDMDELSDDQRESVRQIRKAGSHLLTLINEVLDISRIESGNLQVSIEPMELGPVVADALTLIRPMAEERGIRLPRACGEGVYVRADRQRVTQVLLNLFSNAVKYNREYGEVGVRCLVDDDGVRLAVSDTGLGIAPELLPRVFSAFDRLGAEQRGIEGTGVGLALSKGLVETMGGSLGVESTPGKGTTFTVVLPGALRPVTPPGLAPVTGPDAPTDGRDITVLYVEDNQANIDLVVGFLGRRAGVEVITTMQGRMALDLARLHRPDLVLLDLHLPDLDGEAVLRGLRGHPETADLRVVMLTADATRRQEERLRAVGADDYLTKPLDFHRLTALLQRAEQEARA